MKRRPTGLSRREVLGQGVKFGIAGLLSHQLSSSAFAQDDLAPYRAAKIDWKQADGEQITVAVIPASYFENLISLQPQFEALTGIKLRFEKVPPGQIRQKALLDLSSKTATYATHAADPMYYPLYVSNNWVEPLDKYLDDATLTDKAWFNYDDIIKAWRDADSMNGKPYGVPYDGEVTVQVYRKDLYDAKGLKPADTLEQLVANAKALTDPATRTYGLALRGFSGAGQNMYIYPSLFRSFGGSWMQGSSVVVNSPQAVAALQWYVDTLTAYSPPAVRNWNWPDIADAFSQGTVATYIDAHSSAAVITNPEKSKVVGKIAYARWPKGPNGKRVTSIWNWGFPINAALSEKQKKATWLFIEWAASAETQARTSWKFAGPAKRSGVNRVSAWKSPEFAAAR
jgi:ABC-type glycerol-3-phosphate transport system substrate-binding protein